MLTHGVAIMKAGGLLFLLALFVPLATIIVLIYGVIVIAIGVFLLPLRFSRIKKPVSSA